MAFIYPGVKWILKLVSPTLERKTIYPLCDL